VPTISPPTRTARGQTRGVQSSRRAVVVRDQELPIRSLQEVVRVAAREQPRGRCGSARGSERRLVAAQDPRITGRCPNRGQRSRERVEGGMASRRPDAGPLSEGRGRRRAEDVQVSARELEARLAGVDVRRRDGPDRWLAPRRTESAPCRSARRTSAGSGARRARAPLRRRSSFGRRGMHAAGGRDLPRSAAGRTAARGMLSCKPTQAARRRDGGPGGSRSSRALTDRR